MKGKAVRLERSVYILIYRPSIISTEIDICEIAPSHRKRAPRIRSARANPKRSGGNVTKSKKLSSRVNDQKINEKFFRSSEAFTC